MSQYRFVKKNGNSLLTGLDKPTGGFFWNELDSEEKLVASKSNLSCSELLDDLVAVHNISEDLEYRLLMDWNNDPNPTQFQKNTSKMFGVDLEGSLHRVHIDVNKRIAVIGRGV
jgi:hypothetical protein